MKHRPYLWTLVLLGAAAAAQSGDSPYPFTAGHPSLRGFVLGPVPYPSENRPTPERVALGKTLFFDPRLSGDGNMSCATCHNPALGWSDAQPTARGTKSMVLGRASPTIFNTGYNGIQMWDGRKKSLEDQAMGPMQANVEMNMDIGRLFRWITQSPDYQRLFERAYPGEAINEQTLSKAIASFERTVVSADSPFDRWVRGEARALSTQQVDGFKLFVGRAHCGACHSGPNFTDNGFHNIGLASYAQAEPDMGRYAQKPVNAMKGAFKTPTVREVARTAPYFHDGSASTLMQVVDYYDRGGDVRTNPAMELQPLHLTSEDKLALVAFLESLSSPYVAITIPELPAH